MPLGGRGLRLVLLAELSDRPSMTVAEMAAAVAAWGFEMEGRPSKAVARALRREVRRGQVVTDGQGLYAWRQVPVARRRRSGLGAGHLSWLWAS